MWFSCSVVGNYLHNKSSMWLYRFILIGSAKWGFLNLLPSSCTCWILVPWILEVVCTGVYALKTTSSVSLVWRVHGFCPLVVEFFDLWSCDCSVWGGLITVILAKASWSRSANQSWRFAYFTLFIPIAAYWTSIVITWVADVALVEALPFALVMRMCFFYVCSLDFRPHSKRTGLLNGFWWRKSPWAFSHLVGGVAVVVGIALQWLLQTPCFVR